MHLPSIFCGSSWHTNWSEHPQTWPGEGPQCRACKLEVGLGSSREKVCYQGACTVWERASSPAHQQRTKPMQSQQLVHWGPRTQQPRWPGVSPEGYTQTPVSVRNGNAVHVAERPHLRTTWLHEAPFTWSSARPQHYDSWLPFTVLSCTQQRDIQALSTC